MNRQNKKENRLIDSENTLVVVRGEERGETNRETWRAGRKGRRSRRKDGWEGGRKEAL